MEDKWLEQLKEGKCISERDVKILCDKLKEILCEDGEIEVATEIEEMAHKTYLEKKEEMLKKNGNNFLRGSSDSKVGETKVVPRTKIPPLGSTQKNNNNNLKNNNIKNEKMSSIGVSADIEKEDKKIL